MDRQREEAGKHEAPFISDEMIRLFLLCRLGEDERMRFEERLFSDGGMEERVRLAECELTDDYAFGQLSAEERALVEKNFLVTAERRQKLMVSRALQSHAAAQAATKKSPVVMTESGSNWREKISGLFGFKRPALALAVSFAALVLLSGAIWLALRNPRESGGPAIVKQETLPTPTLTGSPQIATTPTPVTTISPTPTPKVTPTPVEPSQPPVIASVILSPGALRDGGEMARVTLPKGERDLVRLQLALEGSAAGIFRAELLTAEGRKVLVSGSLKASGAGANAKVVFDAPARFLKANDYQIRLSRRTIGGADESVGLYYFRVLPK